MAWWRSGNSTDPTLSPPAPSGTRNKRRSLLEEQARSIKALSRGCRLLVVALRHLAVHSHFSEVKKYRRGLDDLDLDLTDGEIPSEREFRQVAAGLVQELLHLLRSREKVLSGLVEEISAALYQSSAEADGLHEEMLGTIRDISEATALDNMEEMVKVVRAQVRDLSHNAERQRELERSRREALDSELGAMRGQLQQAEQDLQMDVLTGVCSRRWLDEYLQAKLPADEDDILCLIMVDLDHFKVVNDTYGHDVGDEVLKALGRCLNEVVMRKTDFVARYGGEEFAILLDASSLPGGVAVAERLRQAIEAMEVEVGAQTLKVTASLGVAAYQYGESARELFQRADGALYVAKRNGRNRVEGASSDR